MRESNGGKTVGITLRVRKDVLEAYQQLSLRANEIRVGQGGRGDVTAQDVMRDVLSSHPAVKALIDKSLDKEGQGS